MTQPPQTVSWPEVERFGPAALRGGEPFAIFYGPGVSDLFVDTSYQVCVLEQTLWRLLRAEGYERIVFSSSDHPLYFRDAASRNLSRKRQAAGAAGGPRPPGPPGTMRHSAMRGPLGVMLAPGFRPPGGPPSAEAAADPAAGPAPSAGTSDSYAVMTLTASLTRSEHRTAVVFADAEQTLLQTTASRQLAMAMSRWAVHPGNGNVWVMVFRQATLEDVRDFVDTRTPFTALHDFLRAQARTAGRPGTWRVELPQAAELERLVHVTRLRSRLAIGDWRELDAVIRAMAAHPRKIRSWQALLGGLAATGTPLSARVVREEGWGEPAVVSAWERLDAMAGMDTLRDHLDKLRAEAEAIDALGAEGRAATAEPPSLHLVFKGNPGTGKTTVARLVGELYRDLGLLRRGHVVEAKIRDLVAGYVGQTAQLTDATVDEALDGVLFIDEAYALSDQSDGFGDEAVQTLLTRMENDRGRLVVIVAGYPEKMEEFLIANPGLRSRFPQENVLTFPDFPPEVLRSIAVGRLAERGAPLAPQTEEQLGTIVAELHRTRDALFGNARDMRTLGDAVFSQWARRVRRKVDEPVLPEDIPARYRDYLPRPAPAPADLLAGLDAYVGLGPARKALTDLANRLLLRQAGGQGAFAAPHLLFVGPPGTGKTTVAALVGTLFRDLGLLRKGHVVHAGRATLVAPYIGQTAPLVRKACEDAMDGVLFIDEAYSLVQDAGHGGFGVEAIDTLTLEMENRRGRLVVVAAGYPRDMDAFVAANPGLASRFTTRVPFPHYGTDDLVEILRRMAAAQHRTLAPDAAARAAQWLRAARAADPRSFGNARTVRGLLDLMEGRMAERYTRAAPGSPPPSEYTPQDVPDPPEPPYR
jgi:SpoVK/Ycf46/Vps4 family AAA+-type ATPase